MLQRKLRETCIDIQKLLRIGLKGQVLAKEKWYLLEEVKDKFLHLVQAHRFLKDQNHPKNGRFNPNLD